MSGSLDGMVNQSDCVPADVGEKRTLTEQEPLPAEVSRAVMREYEDRINNVAELSQSLALLDTAVGLLPSIEFSRDERLVEFMERKLKQRVDVFGYTVVSISDGVGTEED